MDANAIPQQLDQRAVTSVEASNYAGKRVASRS